MRQSSTAQTLPADVSTALVLAPRAKAAFDALSPSHRREYLTWIEKARRPQTRERRITSMIDKLQNPSHNPGRL